MHRPIAFAMFFSLVFSPATFAPSPRPPITGLGFVRLHVSSLESASKFYETSLGLQHMNECWSTSASMCFFITPYQSIELLKPDGEERHDLVESIGIWTENAGALRGYLLARGVKVGDLVSPFPQFMGEQQFEVSDPEGHRLVFLFGRSGRRDMLDNRAQASHHMIHAGFVVRDRAAEDKFYKDILGFHVYWHGGMKDGEDNWVDMQVPDGTDWIEYMLKVPENASHKTLGVMNHIALGVPDIHKAQEQLVKNGWKGGEEPKIGRDGKWQLNLYDPDETRIELMEFTPTKEPCCSAYTGPHPHP
jgi:catechol 2,3-dioxygenase-like lactoylglutathione lyase family enzyme